MKKNLMILGNTLIVFLILFLIALYIRIEQKNNLSSQTEAFGNMTVAMENMTTNYLVGEQQVCNSWANYINSKAMTADEAIAFVRDSISTPDVMAHILFTDDQELTGLSTAAKSSGGDDYSVSYRNISAFSSGFYEFLGNSVNVTRAYTNPVNAIQSIAFCCPITLYQPHADAPVSAVLLRLIPVSTFEARWAFPTEEYRDAEIALIDSAGDYIIKGYSFKNTNFFEFCQSYNNHSPAAMEALRTSVTGDHGVIEINNSTGQKSLVAHTRVNSTNDWIILTMIARAELSHRTQV